MGRIYVSLEWRKLPPKDKLLSLYSYMGMIYVATFHQRVKLHLNEKCVNPPHV